MQSNVFHHNQDEDHSECNGYVVCVTFSKSQSFERILCYSRIHTIDNLTVEHSADRNNAAVAALIGV